MQNSQIIKLNHNDLLQVANLHQLCFEVYWNQNELSELIRNEVNHFFGIKTESQLIGFCIVAMVKPEADILTFCIHPEFQNQGLGTLLINYIKNYCHKYNIDFIFLDVNINNNNACNFYEKHKFKFLNIRKNYYKNSSGKYEDAKIMKFKF